MVTLTSDFGIRDSYVGAMKGALLEIDDALTLVDITHEIAPQDIAAGSHTLRHGTPTFPLGTVHLAVVDPGVGGKRRAIAIDDGRHRWVGPDNGLFSHVLNLPQIRIHELTNHELHRQPVSPTFHGRDVFAPVAAHLARGLDINMTGRQIEDPIRLPMASCHFLDGTITGRIVHIDHFGNLISNVGVSELERLGRLYTIKLGDASISTISSTYTDAPPGELLALIGSSGLLEIGVRNGSAAQVLAVDRDMLLTIHATEPSDD
ncbi:MAG: SAM-dependent chlorinase/fluorinase [Gemmatimonadetes bacterium]|nr:SAM-dependent chlorinase/fluorinase [Gemmatimonadota bacterium]MBT5142276.1 SAM-dependent chlorinase/fluorinase [Gemmatimonadota bacterium]MBT5589139.1 SAM-dependent chlorinase/fluorinase [Gemmatimonadota bacterium]MBT5963211.1 SAM-dependent chlorinase/fluorinase [Gemmatimonadota bacterium]MBT6630542.1 SAM-dependent chlorinase/fluorinase [Gemmatimonadota bacterium]